MPQPKAVAAALDKAVGRNPNTERGWGFRLGDPTATPAGFPGQGEGATRLSAYDEPGEWAAATTRALGDPTWAAGEVGRAGEIWQGGTPGEQQRFAETAMNPQAWEGVARAAQPFIPAQLQAQIGERSGGPRF